MLLPGAPLINAPDAAEAKPTYSRPDKLVRTGVDFGREQLAHHRLFFCGMPDL